jgi:ribonuclease P protein component
MRAVPKDVNASLFNQQQETENCRASMSLPRSTRLSDSGVIRQVLAQRPQTTKYIAAHSLKGLGVGFALTVPKRLAKRAVDRNRIKRLMREIYRTTTLSGEGSDQLLVLRLRKKIGDRTKNRLREAERLEIRAELKSLAPKK